MHEPSFRLVLTDVKNSTKSGRVKEILGSYDPRKSRDLFRTERIQYWLSRGVTFTPTVNNLLVKHGIVRGKKIDVSSVSKKSAEALSAETNTPKETVEEKVSPTSDTIEKGEEKIAV